MSASGATSTPLPLETAASRAEAAALEVAVIDDPAALGRIADEWQALLATSAADCVFLSWHWVRLWWQVYGNGGRLFVLTARRGGRLVGIAPFMIRRERRFGLIGYRVLMMIGMAGGTLAERFAIIAAPGAEAEVSETFVRALGGPLSRHWDMLRFERLLDDSLPTRRLLEALERNGIQTDKTITRTALFATLPDSMDAYLASRSSNFRSQYRGSVRKVDKLGEVRLLMAGRDISVADAMAILGRLHRQRFDADASGSFRSDDYLRFHGRLAEALQADGCLWLGILEAGGKPIAARYDFVYGGKVWCMQGGWEPEHSSLRPGTVLTGAVFEWAIGQGLGEYDFLCGGEGYKSRWATGERTLSGLRAFNTATLRGRALSMLASFERRLRGSRRGKAGGPTGPASG